MTLQLHQADDAKVSLMEIRFYVPSGDGEGDAVEVKSKNIRFFGFSLNELFESSGISSKRFKWRCRSYSEGR